MSSASSPARRALEDFVAGRLAADRLIAAIASRYYGGAGQGERDALRPVVELAERAAPGVVSLERTAWGAGFDVRPVGRTFPAEYETALRDVAAAALAAPWADAVPPSAPRAAATEPAPAAQGWVARMLGAVRRLFSASA